MFVSFAIAAICLSQPVNGPALAPYSPIGQYGGHWGIDFEASLGDDVRAPASGLVTFAGPVAGMKSVTIQPVPGFKVSISYLSEVSVARGVWVTRGDYMGAAGVEDGRPSVHLSTRIDGKYVDPAGQLRCRSTDIARALRLVTPPAPYPRRRAHRNPRRDLRPDSRGPFARCGNSPTPGRSRPCSSDAGGRSVAEGGSLDHFW